MMRTILTTALLASVFLLGADRMTAADEPGKAVAHMVYFSLKDSSPEAKQKLVAACKKYLTKHPGELYFAAGVRAEDFKREVNDKDFDVSLHIVFKDKAAHDAYAVAKRHLEFIEEQKGNWAKVRVLDSYVEQ
jgi:Stress responsive A/B Barrel Domain